MKTDLELVLHLLLLGTALRGNPEPEADLMACSETCPALVLAVERWFACHDFAESDDLLVAAQDGAQEVSYFAEAAEVKCVRQMKVRLE